MWFQQKHKGPDQLLYDLKLPNEDITFTTFRHFKNISVRNDQIHSTHFTQGLLWSRRVGGVHLISSSHKEFYIVSNICFSF